MKNTIVYRLLVLGLLVVFAAQLRAQNPDYLYEEWRLSPFPDKGIEVSSNPVTLLWPSAKRMERKNCVYNVYLSPDNDFPENKTIKSMGQRPCFYNTHVKLKPGKWYWKYEQVEKTGKVTSKGVFSFVVTPDAEGVVTPAFAELLNRIPTSHPRIMNYGRSMKDIHKEAPTHPIYKDIISRAEKVLKREIYRGPITDEDQAKARAIGRITNYEVKYYHTLLEGYVLSDDKRMLDALLQRTEVLLTWPTHDLTGAGVLSALSKGYDVLFDVLSESNKQKMLAVIDRQLKHGVQAWPGTIEARHVENHFWQAEVAGNFTAALATLGHLESARDMLQYTYELFIARFPNLGTQEGGWAEGEGYYGVNKSAIVDMSLLLKKLCGVDVYKLGWYRNLPDYYTYFAPVAAPVSGFGDMHDRISIGTNMSPSEMLVISSEENDPKALYRLANTLKSVNSFYPNRVKKDRRLNRTKSLQELEPWYQVANDIRLDLRQVKTPKNMPHDKVFYGVGAAALHNDVLRPDINTTVFFRSSPFGAKGHMHANQNAFNLSRKGERLFYSTGYYTTFADPHSLSSYRHTRAHNTILVNGCGQAFGHESYGWIKRHIEGKELSYICGDATSAYRPMVDEQFLELCGKNGIENTPEYGFGDAKLKQFERHLVFLRPDIVVIYDILESEQPSEWSFLLHTLQPSVLAQNGELTLRTTENTAVANVFGSSRLKSQLTDRFFSPVIDYKKKYGATPPAYHTTYSNIEKCKRMRFLSIIRLADSGMEVMPLKENGKGRWTVGEVMIEAELNGNNPARLKVKSGRSTLYVNGEKGGQAYTVLRDEKGKELRSEDCKRPVGNYVY